VSATQPIAVELAASDEPQRPGNLAALADTLAASDLVRRCEARILAARERDRGVFPLLFVRCLPRDLVHSFERLPRCRMHDRFAVECQAEIEESRSADPGCSLSVKWTTAEEYERMSSDDRADIYMRGTWAACIDRPGK